MYEGRTTFQINDFTPHFAKPLLCVCPTGVHMRASLNNLSGYFLYLSVNRDCSTWRLHWLGGFRSLSATKFLWKINRWLRNVSGMRCCIRPAVCLTSDTSCCPDARNCFISRAVPQAGWSICTTDQFVCEGEPVICVSVPFVWTTMSCYLRFRSTRLQRWSSRLRFHPT